VTSHGQAELFGLVLAGGTSRRMGEVKSQISWRGQSLCRRAYNLLAPVCSSVLVSCRSDRAEALAKYPIVYDQFGSKGPMDGIASAMSAHPQNPWLVLAVDLPLIESDLMQALVRQRDKHSDITLFKEPGGELQSLFAIYEKSMLPLLLAALEQECYALRKVLVNAQCKIATHPHTQNQLLNLNTPEDLRYIRSIE